MKKVEQSNFIKRAKAKKYVETEFVNFGDDRSTYSQGIYLINKKGNFYGYVQLSFKKQNELQQNGYLRIFNAAGSEQIKKL